MKMSRVAIAICQVVLLANSVLMEGENTCSAPFKEEEPNVCLHRSSETYSYCWAHEHCYKEKVGGRGFIAGEYYKDNSVPKYPDSWTGLHRLSTDTSVKTDKWSVADPQAIAVVIREKHLMRISDDLHEEEGRILKMGSTNLEKSLDFDGEKAIKNGVLCQVSGIGETKIDPLAVESFKRVRGSDTHLPSNKINGCPIDGKAETNIACAMRCKLERRCRSFAYHPDTSACVLQFHVPSKLKSDVEPKDGRWERFVRPKW